MTITERQIMHKYIDILKEIKRGGDRELDHVIADNALKDALRELGFHDLSNEYDKAESRADGFWYA